ncbi:OLC1v1030564C3 [Oldenlandia corymbosa var. corymbosa]|uniref:OLC1v1030564C3 n=1 Tax=Oldenlandia corymbosa var. corymbosa TaxID=529605 RepID=A0AAV1CIB3_OLDCO|nr:OLC1v1030564C3 [Oldenlandia corymbosa var. corymbosa]
MASVSEIIAHEEHQLADSLQALSIETPSELMEEEAKSSLVLEGGGIEIVSMEPKVGSGLDSSRVDTDNSQHYGFCAICLNTIVLQETALVKGCEHAYCVTCILRWASFKKDTCPQCKHPFEFLYVHRSLDGSIYDYMFEESVCLLLRASWFKPLDMEEKEGFYDDMGYFYAYEDEEEEYIDEVYFGTISRRIGNRRWGDNGYVRSGRQEARPVLCPNVSESSAGPSRLPRKIEAAACKESASVGRRAKRALKREAADKAAAAKHQKHLVRLGRK